MQIYSDMVFSGVPQAIQRFLEQLDGLAKIGVWTRDTKAEEAIRSLLPEGEIVRSYCNKSLDELPQANLWLKITADEWSVTNIVPVGSEPLTPSDYARLLSDFRDGILPYANAYDVSISQPKSEVGPEHFLSERSARMLKQFSLLANKTTGASHPRDLQRWNKFVISVHQDRCGIGAGELQQLLIENEHWPEEKAAKLSLLFEYENSLLKTFDEYR